MTKKTKVKLIIAAVLIVLVAIVVFQNRKPVPARVFWISDNISLALLLLVTLAVGFAVGLIAASSRTGKKK